MGADLYIKNMDREKQSTGFEVSDKARKDGYFRDCYNDGGLFAVMSANTDKELSWWGLARRKELFSDNDEECLMSVDGAKKLRDELEPIIKGFLKKKKMYYASYSLDNHKNEKGKEIDKKNVKEYRDWARGLLEFLDLAISCDSEIIFSV